ncbi:MAG: branched-chain amino acid ABC transporter permease [Rhizobiales bacterium]|nr:branched-chain amino acid ABC transporter permease [Hyphomicrobiales bacterium]
MIGLVISGLVQGILTGLMLAFLTVGMTLIYRISRLTNFAHGSLFVVAMYLTFALSRSIDINPLLFALVITPLMACLGWALYWGLIHPIRTRHHLLAVQLLLGLSFVLDASILIGFGGDLQSVESPFNSRFVHILGTGFTMTTMIGASISLVGLGVLALAIQWSDFGRHLRAVANDNLAARLAGLSVERLEGLTWALGVGMLGIIAPPMSSIVTLTPDIGLQYTVLSLVILIVGGMGSLVGTIFAGLVVGIAQSLGLLFLPGSFGALLPYALLVGVLMLRPGGFAALLVRS